MRAKQRIALFGSLKAMTMAAMLTAMSVVIGIFCKNFLNFGAGPYAGLFRITFENLPILAAGLMFGPVVGAAAGLSADLISYLLSRQVYPINPLVTLGAMAIGLISGLMAHYVIKHPGKLRIIVACATAHLVGSMIIKPLGLYQFYGVAVLWRIPLYMAIAPVEIAILCLLYRNRMVRAFIDHHTTGGKHEHRRGA
jgi:ECF transporter S component (folate family)